MAAPGEHVNVPGDGAELNSRKPRRRLRWIAGALFVLWAAAAALLVASASLSARAGIRATDSIRGIASEDLMTLQDSLGGPTDDVEEESAGNTLLTAAAEFSTAEQRLKSPVLAPLRLLPVLGRQLRSAEALSTAAATTASEAGSAVNELEGILEASTATASDRVAAIEAAEEVLTDLEAGLDDLDLGPEDGLLPQLAKAHDQFYEEYSQVTDTLATSTTAARGMREFLSGPTSYLLLAANNAEMRAGAGMYLQAAKLDVNEGVFSVGQFEATQDLVLPQSVGLIDPDVQAHWGQLEPSREWRNVNLSPRFDATAVTAAEMWAARTGERVDGVMTLDVPGIRRLLEVTGPVTLPSGETVGADTVERDLLVGQYGDFGVDRGARRERLGQVADAVLEALNTRAISASELLRALRDLGADRHLLAWSSDAAQQDAWVALDTDGQVPADGLMLSLMNRGGNKLDPYLEVDSIVLSQKEGDVRHIEVDVRVDNVAPADLTPYVSGPYPGLDLAAGEYKGILMLTIPGSAGNMELPVGSVVALGNDGANKVAAVEIRIPAGSNDSVRFTFDMPAEQKEITLLPSARVPATTWVFGSETFTDDQVHGIDLDARG